MLKSRQKCKFDESSFAILMVHINKKRSYSISITFECLVRPCSTPSQSNLTSSMSKKAISPPNDEACVTCVTPLQSHAELSHPSSSRGESSCQICESHLLSAGKRDVECCTCDLTSVSPKPPHYDGKGKQAD